MLLTIFLLMFLNSIYGMESNQCSPNQLQETLSRATKEECRPRPVIVPVPNPTDTLQLMAPTHVEVMRCVGSCSHFQHSCVPSEVKMKSVPLVLTEHTIEQGFASSYCGEVEIEEHISCDCGCQLSTMSCSPYQLFLPYECRCACKNAEERDSCLSQGWHWDRDSCQCMCPGRPYPMCPSSYMFDYLYTCSCVQLQSFALTELELVVLVLSLSLAGAIFSILQCYRRKIGLFKADRKSHSFPVELEEALPSLKVDGLEVESSLQISENLLKDNG